LLAKQMLGLQLPQSLLLPFPFAFASLSIQSLFTHSNSQFMNATNKPRHKIPNIEHSETSLFKIGSFLILFFTRN
jgi:hypothetical protein